VRRQERALILRTHRYGDADLIVHALNSEGGRLTLFARSALKSKKRFGGGVLEPTHYVQIAYEDRRSKIGGDSEMYTLHEASLVQDFAELRSDYDRLQTALRLVQTVDRVVGDMVGGSPEVFNLLGNALRALMSSSSPERLHTHFCIRLLASQGVLENESETSRLAAQPIQAHAESALDDLDWRRLSREADRALCAYAETGAV